MNTLIKITSGIAIGYYAPKLFKKAKQTLVIIALKKQSEKLRQELEEEGIHFPKLPDEFTGEAFDDFVAEFDDSLKTLLADLEYQKLLSDGDITDFEIKDKDCE